MRFKTKVVAIFPQISILQRNTIFIEFPHFWFDTATATAKLLSYEGDKNEHSSINIAMPAEEVSYQNVGCSGQQMADH